MTIKKGKAEAKQIRDEDLTILEADTIGVSFDLEDVFALPRTNVSSAFYKRMLNTFNLPLSKLEVRKPMMLYGIRPRPDDLLLIWLVHYQICNIRYHLTNRKLKKQYCGQTLVSPKTETKY